ncbi:MAG: metallophosphoesterase [Anaerolineaceae bacterium]|nr:metallophosphoesterase [Anaerolineaceae bacterium]
MANYYIADLHIGHENVIRFDQRPFSSLSEMHDTIIRNWNQVVTGNDTVYILGDFIWKSEKDWVYWVSPLAGKKVLVLGNHDPKQFSPEIRRLFLDVRSYMDIADEGRRVILCHYPIPFHVADYSENCYMLYGHVHNTREETLLRRFRKEIQDACTERGHARGNFINVGCMMPWMNYTPQTLTSIIENEAKWRQEHTADGGQTNER